MIVAGIQTKEVYLEVDIDKLAEMVKNNNDTLEECLDDLEYNLDYYLSKLGLDLTNIELSADGEDDIISAVEDKIHYD